MRLSTSLALVALVACFASTQHVLGDGLPVEYGLLPLGDLTTQDQGGPYAIPDVQAFEVRCCCRRLHALLSDAGSSSTFLLQWVLPERMAYRVCHPLHSMLTQICAASLLSPMSRCSPPAVARSATQVEGECMLSLKQHALCAQTNVCCSRLTAHLADTPLGRCHQHQHLITLFDASPTQARNAHCSPSRVVLPTPALLCSTHTPTQTQQPPSLPRPVPQVAPSQTPTCSIS